MSLLFWVLVMAGIFALLSRLPPHDTLFSLAEHQVKAQHLYIAWACCTLMIVYLGAGIVLLVFLDVVLFWVVGASAVLVGVHAALHDVRNALSFVLGSN